MATLTREAAVDVMLTAVARGEPNLFYVGVVGYFIEGVPYSASGLAVDPDSTPNLRATADGFACDALCPAGMLEDSIVRAKGIITSDDGDALVSVTVEVKQCDIWAVAKFVDGEQQNLFVDPGARMTRQIAFMREWDSRGAPEKGIS